MISLVHHDLVLQLVPQRLDLVEVGRVRRHKEQKATHLLQKCGQLWLAMEGGIVQDHGLPANQSLTKLLFKPCLDQRRIAVALKRQWRDDLALAQARSHRNSRGAVAQLLGETTRALAAPTPGIAQGVFDARFIHINPIVGRDLTQLLLKVRSLGGVALLIKKTLFLRVHPMRRRAREKAIRLSFCPVSRCQATAI